MATQIDLGTFEEDAGSSAEQRALENSIYGTADQLRRLRATNRSGRIDGPVAFPRRDNVRIAVDHVVRALFPRRLGGLHEGAADEDAFVFRELEAGLSFLTAEVESETAYWEAKATAAFEPGRAQEVVRFFCDALPKVRELVDSDIDAAFQGDPSVRTIEEILVSYPGAHAILYHRLAHELHKLGSPIVARMISEDAHARTGVDIHPGATIGASFFIDHGTGVVIGETAVIGTRVRIYQQVTLGARAPHGPSARRPLTNYARHPVVEDDVIIYAGATILGRVTVGAKSIIGGNTWILADVPSGAIVTQPGANIASGGDADLERELLFGQA